MKKGGWLVFTGVTLLVLLIVFLFMIIPGRNYHYCYPTTPHAEIKAIIDTAEKGDSEACYRLGVLHAMGDGVEYDYVLAAQWLEKAARQGHPRAQSELGLLYALGVGVERDKGLAMKWYAEAAKNGDAAAHTGIGSLFFTNRQAVTAPYCPWPYEDGEPVVFGGYQVWMLKAHVLAKVSGFRGVVDDSVFWKQYRADHPFAIERKVLERWVEKYDERIRRTKPSDSRREAWKEDQESRLDLAMLAMGAQGRPYLLDNMLGEHLSYASWFPLPHAKFMVTRNQFPIAAKKSEWKFRDETNDWMSEEVFKEEPFIAYIKCLEEMDGWTPENEPKVTEYGRRLKTPPEIMTYLSDLGYPPAQRRAAEWAESPAEAYRLLSEAGRGGDWPARYRLILTYLQGNRWQGDNSGDVLEEKWLAEAAAHADFRHVEAVRTLFARHVDAILPALKHYKKRGEDGSGLAMLYYGLHLDREGGDRAAATRWYLRAAEAGVPAALYLIALRCDAGETIPFAGELPPFPRGANPQSHAWRVAAAEKDYGPALFDVAAAWLSYPATDPTPGEEGISAVRAWFFRALDHSQWFSLHGNSSQYADMAGLIGGFLGFASYCPQVYRDYHDYAAVVSSDKLRHPFFTRTFGSLLPLRDAVKKDEEGTLGRLTVDFFNEFDPERRRNITEKLFIRWVLISLGEDAFDVNAPAEKRMAAMVGAYNGTKPTYNIVKARYDLSVRDIMSGLDLLMYYQPLPGLVDNGGLKDLFDNGYHKDVKQFFVDDRFDWKQKGSARLMQSARQIDALIDPNAYGKDTYWYSILAQNGRILNRSVDGVFTRDAFDLASVLIADQSCTIAGGANSDVLIGTDGADILQARGAGDVLYGRGGDDLLYGGKGADVYVWGRGDGNDVIDDPDGRSSLLLRNLTPDEITLSFGPKGMNDIVVAIPSSGERLVVTGVPESDRTTKKAGRFAILEVMEFADGTVWKWKEIWKRLVEAQQ